MPTQSPRKPRPKAKAVDSAESIDWLALWALSLGVCAIVLAGIAYFSIGDKIGASFILTATAALMAAVLHAASAPRSGR